MIFDCLFNREELKNGKECKDLKKTLETLKENNRKDAQFRDHDRRERDFKNELNETRHAAEIEDMKNRRDSTIETLEASHKNEIERIEEEYKQKASYVETDVSVFTAQRKNIITLEKDKYQAEGKVLGLEGEIKTLRESLNAETNMNKFLATLIPTVDLKDLNFSTPFDPNAMALVDRALEAAKTPVKGGNKKDK